MVTLVLVTDSCISESSGSKTIDKEQRLCEPARPTLGDGGGGGGAVHR